MMPAQAHRIGRLGLEVEIAGLDRALQLRGRIEELSRTRFPEVLERVLERSIPADLHVRLERLDLDLGMVGAERLEEDAAELLERALTEALADAVERARRTPGAEGRALTGGEAALEDLDSYLVRGTPRFQAAAGGYDPAADLRSLIAAEPRALTAMLRRRARDRHSIERLVLQAGAEDLRALLAMLAPADAAVILAYHADLRRLYAESRAAPEAPALPRALWVLTLEFILRDPGSQSNRRAFLTYLLEGMAMAEGIAYPALLALLHDALEQSRERQPPTGSLPGVLKELLERLGDEGIEPVPRPQVGTEGRPPPQARARQGSGAAVGPPSPLRDWLAALVALHRQRPLLALSEAAFERALRRSASGLPQGEAGGGFDRRRQLSRLLRALAKAGGVSHAFLVESIAFALASARSAGAPAGPAAALAADLPRAAVDGPGATGADPVAGFVARFRRHAQDEAAMAALVSAVGSAEFRLTLERLRPGDAEATLADLAELAEVQRSRSLFALSDGAFETRLRTLALQLAVGAGTPLGRADRLRHLLTGLARAAGVGEERLPALVAGAAEVLPPGSVLGKVTAEMSRAIDPNEAAWFGPAGMRTAEAAEFRERDAIALARRLAEAGPSDKARLLRRLAGDEALLLRVAARMDEAGLAASLESLGPARAAAVAEDLAFLRRRHSAEPLAALGAADFDRLAWTLAAAALARMGGKLRRAELRRGVLAGIARHEGVPLGVLGDWRRLGQEDRAATVAIAPGPGPADSPPAERPAAELLAVAERFLRTGQPPASGALLAEAARRAPAAFAALLRRLRAAASGRSAALVDRLLEWMLPEEIAEALVPGSADQAECWAASLADAPGGTLKKAWEQVLDVALAEGKLEPADAEIAPWRLRDRHALLRHWLDHGGMAWWAPPGLRVETLLSGLAGEPAASLQTLFGGSHPEHVATRLGRAFRELGSVAGATLLERLAPAAFAEGGPLAARASGLSGAALDELRIRAAAAAIAGSSPEPDRLDRPVPMPSDPRAPSAASPAPDGRSELFEWLRDGGPGGPPARLLRLFAQLADRGDFELVAVLREGLASPGTRARWAETMAEDALSRILHLVAPAQARFILDLKSILLEARSRGALPSGSDAGRTGPWKLLLEIAAERDRLDPRSVADRLILVLAGNAPDAARGLRSEAILTARRGGHGHVVAALRSARSAEPPRVPRAVAAPRRPAAGAPPPAPEAGETIYVGNAGLVLFNPFLPRFFDRLGLFSTGADGIERIAGIEAISRAAHLLQYLVDRSCDRPESDLALNKLLCGVPTAAPVARAIEPTVEELAICDQLVQAVLAHWPALKGTSPAGLRETFLQREGRLRRGDDRWTLEVQHKTVDVLVNQIPWSYSVVYHRWMPEPLHVTW